MTSGTKAGARHERRIDWRLGADLLARGISTAAVAQRLGCSRSHLSNKRREDPDFQSMIEEARTRAPAVRLDRIDTLKRAVHDAIEAEVRAGNVRVILWLADRLELVSPPSERTPEEELRDILRGLGPDELQEFESLRDQP
jgi:transcriptional regulator with XRE-family HTH domain